MNFALLVMNLTWSAFSLQLILWQVYQDPNFLRIGLILSLLMSNSYWATFTIGLGQITVTVNQSN